MRLVHEVASDVYVADTWRVEAVGPIGEVFVAVFSGPNAEGRARGYARACNYASMSDEEQLDHNPFRIVNRIFSKEA